VHSEWVGDVAEMTGRTAFGGSKTFDRWIGTDGDADVCGDVDSAETSPIPGVKDSGSTTIRSDFSGPDCTPESEAAAAHMAAAWSAIANVAFLASIGIPFSLNFRHRLFVRTWYAAVIDSNA
jgi:hypothetical protein